MQRAERYLMKVICLLALTGCLEGPSDQSASNTLGGGPTTNPSAPGNSTPPSTALPALQPNPNSAQPACGLINRASNGFDCNGRSLDYPIDQFDFKNVIAPHNVLTDGELDQANEVLACSKIGVSYCEGICVNQAFNFRHRFGLLFTGYIWPDSKCGYYILQHNSETDLVSFEYFEGQYVNSGSSVVGNCQGTNLNQPSQRGYYSFVENYVPSGQISPAPDRSRLYYSFDMLDINRNPAGQNILPNYQPMSDSNVVYSFERPYGPISAHYELLGGFQCVKREQITPAVIDLIR